MNTSRPHRRDFLRSLALGAVTLGLPTRRASLAQADRTDRPNFIVFVADDLGWNDLGCYGHPHIRTPNIDHLAGQGLRFESAFLTCASCSPTRCSVMTGRYPHCTGAANLHQPLPADQVAFPGLLRQAGYYTASAGKWHLGPEAKKNFDAVIAPAGPSGCETWVDTLRNRPKDRPFFLWLASLDPHRGYEPGAIARPHTPADAVVPPFLPDIPETRRELALYYDEISRLDGFVGQVLAELDAQGIADNTFVLFFSDNGCPFPRCKTTVYDSGVRTPLLVRWPRRIRTPGVCSSLVSAVDIAPTICALAGEDMSPRFQGSSFAELLANPKLSIREYVFAEHNWHDYQAHERMVRSRQFLYIRNEFVHLPGTPPADAVRGETFQAMIRRRDQGRLPPEQRGCFVVPRDREELYDVRRDPYNLLNVAQDAKYKQELEVMRRVLDEWARQTADSVPAEPAGDRFDRQSGLPF
ncbi:MAG: sulfatase [Sedimentisphaerales bacterium]|nr:sulfatase [Sedimentisphaerales bacterium]